MDICNNYIPNECTHTYIYNIHTPTLKYNNALTTELDKISIQDLCDYSQTSYNVYICSVLTNECNLEYLPTEHFNQLRMLHFAKLCCSQIDKISFKMHLIAYFATLTLTLTWAGQ